MRSDLADKDEEIKSQKAEISKLRDKVENLTHTKMLEKVKTKKAEAKVKSLMEHEKLALAHQHQQDTSRNEFTDTAFGDAVVSGHTHGTEHL